MIFDAVFNFSQDLKPVALGESRHMSISRIDECEFYVKPLLNEVKSVREHKILLCSAPGATGKSALAKYVSSVFRGVYWDLSKIKLGENSLHGTLMRAMGSGGFADFLAAFSRKEALLVIDAFDEADMISGRDSVVHLLEDLNSLVSDADGCSLVLLARTETAKFIYEYFKNAGTCISHYEISFFSESQRIQFVKEKLRFSGVDVTPAIDQCIGRLFEQVSAQIGSGEAVKSFLGYAPVLEAISKAVESEPNAAKLLSRLSVEADIDSVSMSIISTIMRDLLERERGKVCNGLLEKCKSRHHEFDVWEDVYSEKEQLVRLACYVLLQEIKYKDCVLGFIPDKMIDDYEATFKMFLKEHPFILTTIEKDGSCRADFAGPAFRDYAFAHLVQDKAYEFLVDEYFNANKARSRSHFPSQLFFDFYVFMASGRMAGHHFPLMYDSFKSKEGADDEASVSVFCVDGCKKIDFVIEKQRTGQNIKTLNVYMSDAPFCITQLSNSVVVVDGDVVVGSASESTRISGSIIDAGRIIWNTANVRLEAFAGSKTVIVSKERPESKTAAYPNFDVKISEKEDLKVSFPDFSGYYRLREFSFSVEDIDDIDIFRFSHALRSVLIHFRRDKKDTPAKHKDFIDNVVVSGNGIKRAVFDFLISMSAIYIDPKEQNLYKLNHDVATNMGINWVSLSPGNVEMLEKCYDEFVRVRRVQ